MQSFCLTAQVDQSVDHLLEAEGPMALHVAMSERRAAIEDNDFIAARFWDEVTIRLGRLRKAPFVNIAS